MAHLCVNLFFEKGVSAEFPVNMIKAKSESWGFDCRPAGSDMGEGSAGPGSFAIESPMFPGLSIYFWVTWFAEKQFRLIEVTPQICRLTSALTRPQRDFMLAFSMIMKELISSFQGLMESVEWVEDYPNPSGSWIDLNSIGEPVRIRIPVYSHPGYKLVHSWKEKGILLSSDAMRIGESQFLFESNIITGEFLGERPESIETIELSATGLQLWSELWASGDDSRERVKQRLGSPELEAEEFPSESKGAIGMMDNPVNALLFYSNQIPDHVLLFRVLQGGPIQMDTGVLV